MRIGRARADDEMVDVWNIDEMGLSERCPMDSSMKGVWERWRQRLSTVVSVPRPDAVQRALHRIFQNISALSAPVGTLGQ